MARQLLLQPAGVLVDRLRRPRADAGAVGGQGQALPRAVARRQEAPSALGGRIRSQTTTAAPSTRTRDDQRVAAALCPSRLDGRRGPPRRARRRRRVERRASSIVGLSRITSRIEQRVDAGRRRPATVPGRRWRARSAGRSSWSPRRSASRSRGSRSRPRRASFASRTRNVSCRSSPLARARSRRRRAPAGRAIAP